MDTQQQEIDSYGDLELANQVADLQMLEEEYIKKILLKENSEEKEND